MAKNLRKILTICLIVTLCMSMFTMHAFAEETNVAKIDDMGYATLEDAVAAANSAEGTDVTITLIGDAYVNATLTIKKNITIKGEYTINWTNIAKSMFTINAGASLTLDGGVIIDCGNEWVLDEELYEYYLNNPYAEDGLNAITKNKPNDIDMYPVTSESGKKDDFGAKAHLINNNGTLTVNDAVIQNFYSVSVAYNNSYGYAATDGKMLIVAGKNSTTNLNKGAVFQHNATGNSGLIVNASSSKAVHVDGAVIQNNFAGGNGGMFKIYYTPMTLTDGLIYNNKGTNANGIVVMLYGSGSKLEMSGGKICSNSAIRGYTNGFNSSVYLHNNSEMYMSGGYICCNRGCQGGGIYAKYPDNCFLDITFGYVIDNVSIANTGYHDVGGMWVSDDDYWGKREDLAKVWGIKGGVYTQDVSKWCNPFNYICVPYVGSADKDDDFIVTVGYNVKYYELTENAETGVNEETHLHTEQVLVNEGEAIDPKGYAYYPIQSGCAIQDWFLDKELTNQYDFTTPVEGHTNLYGKWIDVPVITFEVFDFTTNETIENATIVLKDMNGNIIDSASNDPNAFVVESGKWYTYEVTAEGYYRVQNVVYVEDDQSVRVVMREITSGDENTPIRPSNPSNNNNTVDIPDNVALAGPDVFTTDHFAYIIGSDDGLVHPEANITRAEVATIFFRLLKDEVREQYMTKENSFSDVNEGDWYNAAVSTMVNMGVINGYPDGTFRPQNNITRAEFAAIAARFAPGSESEAFFTDISGHWAEDEIAIAAFNGWVTGYEDNSFRPDNSITRAEAMTLVNRILLREPESAEDLLPGMVEWIDNMDTAAWYYLAVQEATNSHYYEYKDDGYETWTELRENRDWSELEK